MFWDVLEWKTFKNVKIFSPYNRQSVNDCIDFRTSKFNEFSLFLNLGPADFILFLGPQPSPNDCRVFPQFTPKIFIECTHSYL